MSENRLRGLLIEALAALDTFADVAPAVSLRADIRAALAEPAQPAAQALDAADARRFRAFVAAVLNGDKIFKNAGVEADQGRPETLDAVRQAVDAAIAAQEGK